MINESYVTHFWDSTKYPKLTYLVHKSANENPNKKNGIDRFNCLARKTTFINKNKIRLVYST